MARGSMASLLLAWWDHSRARLTYRESTGRPISRLQPQMGQLTHVTHAPSRTHMPRWTCIACGVTHTNLAKMYVDAGRSASRRAKKVCLLHPTDSTSTT